MTKKFKAYFTLAEFEHLRNSTDNVYMKKYLNRRIRDINDGHLQAEFDTTIVSIEKKLGFDTTTEKAPEFDKIEYQSYLDGTMTKEEEYAYEIKQGRKV